jgi:hypothetical protein
MGAIERLNYQERKTSQWVLHLWVDAKPVFGSRLILFSKKFSV